MNYKKLSITYQSEAAECGLACIAMLANFHGHKIDLTLLRSRYSVSLKGASLQQLVVLANQLGLAGRALRLEPEELHKLQTPCILHWEMNHFVVLKQVHRNGITILDPAMGERRLSMKDVDKAFTGVALELTPTGEFKTVDERVKLSLTSFWSKVQGLAPALLKLFVLSLVLQLFALASPYYTQLVVDDVLVSQDKPLLVVLALGFGLIMLIQIIIKVLRSWIALHLGTMMNMQMVTNLFRHLLHLPVPYFENRHMGDITSRFGALSAVQSLLTSSLVEGLLDGIMVIAVFAMMYLYSPQLSLVVVCAVVLYAFFRWMFYWPMRQLTEQSIVAGAKEDSVFMESIRAVRTIKLFGQQSQRLSIWQNTHVEAINSGYRLAKWGISASTVNQLLFGIEGILVIYLAAHAVLDGSMTVGMLFAFMAYKSQFTGRMSALISLVVQIKMTKLHLERLADIALTDKEDEGTGVAANELTGQLSLKNVSFRYANTEPLLFNELELDVQAGENVAIIGPSGCGKSSLLKLMLGLMPAESGKVEADGVDVRQSGLRFYRSQIAAVMQDDQLMSGTLAENISFFDSQVDMQQVIACARLAGIDQDISAMPMGYNSLIGDMGNSLSGGQKQRLFLARALYRQPKILFMDEATSHLDVQLEHQVNQAISQLKITRIIIAHRPQTIVKAQRILRLHHGQLQDVTESFKSKYQQDEFTNEAIL
ncbi:ABC-type bacteriocin/lantibiotic exporter with N-terminal double-glycine peptidase domain protein [Rheinheimera sp. A13L]|uniref:peptidase domain-containing ABC transporter n=1 Tax=Rheinheimera sp. A13L TaxID=506534 RepID=UPI00021250A2|nr:peptidase domain-containing ABC transporter [Rheinheimera sp. A13L]EGM79259.1 ABC-type bacteriocin/lantibiotic exporter with N-terminal double-glycine peptidase domain protein [Rheinheimera sp. A13L]